MLYLHKSFFAQSLLPSSSTPSLPNGEPDPLHSPYAPSFLATYRSAYIIIRAFVYQWQRSPEITMRLWSLLSHFLSAAMVMGIIASRTPRLWIAGGAMADLEVCLKIFERIGVQSRNAKAGAVCPSFISSLSLISLLHTARAKEAESQGRSGETARRVTRALGRVVLRRWRREGEGRYRRGGALRRTGEGDHEASELVEGAEGGAGNGIRSCRGRRCRPREWSGRAGCECESVSDRKGDGG